MKKILNENDLFCVLDEEKDIILYGAGYVSSLILRYLKIQKLKHKVLCLAVERMENNKDSVEDVPVVPVHNLLHFSNESTIIVATREKKQDEIVKVLEQYDFNDIVCMSDIFIDEAERLVKNTQVITNTELLSKIEFARISACEQNEICEVNSAAFKKYKNSHIGQEIAIVGTGPTLNKYVPMENVIHIGTNGAWRRKDIEWKYYFAQDFDRRNIEHKDFVENVKCQQFLGRYSQNYAGCKYFEAPVSYGLIRDNISHYFLDVCPSKEMYLDIAYHPLFSYGSVIFPAIQFALYTNPKRIYLIGCDTTSSGYAYKSNEKKQYLNHTSLWKVGYAKLKTFAEYYYPDTEIISINPVGLRKLYKDIYTDDISVLP